MARKKNKAVKRIVEEKGETSAAIDDADKPPDAVLNKTDDQNGGGASASTSSDDRRIADFNKFSYEELKNATNNFSSKIGEGRFGPIYKASLQTDQTVAVRMLNREGDNKFLAMIMILPPLRHPNLVNLIGFSTETQLGIMRFLVYEYMPLGSLHKHLHQRPRESEPLDWAARMRIALGIARGLDYLHDVARPRLIFSDLTTSKVLLDDAFLPRLSGFGFPKLQKPDPTEGYYAPEYCKGGEPTIESDVYAFRVILLELITGRRPRDIVKEQGGNCKLYDWFNPIYEERNRNKVDEVVDPEVKGKTGTREGFFGAAATVLVCLQEDPRKRLTMRETVLGMEFVVSKAAGDQIFTFGAAAEETRVEDATKLAEAKIVLPKDKRVIKKYKPFGSRKVEESSAAGGADNRPPEDKNAGGASALTSSDDRPIEVLNKATNNFRKGCKIGKGDQITTGEGSTAADETRVDEDATKSAETS